MGVCMLLEILTGPRETQRLSLPLHEFSDPSQGSPVSSHFGPKMLGVTSPYQ
jgi:hypothetical protein